MERKNISVISDLLSFQYSVVPSFEYYFRVKVQAIFKSHQDDYWFTYARALAYDELDLTRTWLVRKKTVISKHSLPYHITQSSIRLVKNKPDIDEG